MRKVGNAARFYTVGMLALMLGMGMGLDGYFCKYQYDFHTGRWYWVCCTDEICGQGRPLR